MPLWSELRAWLEERLRRLFQARSASAFQHALLAAQAEASIEGILVVDERGRMISSNSRFAELWGMPADILASRSDARALQHVLDLLVEPKSFLARVQYLYGHPDEISYDELALRDGRIFERYSSPIRGPRGERYGRIWYFRDVTHRKEAEQARFVLERETIQARFVANVSHELRTPIAAIKGSAQTLRLWALDDAESRPALVRSIEHQADRLARMVEDLLRLSELGSLKSPLAPEPVVLAEFVERFLTGLSSRTKRKKLAVVTDVPPSLEVSADLIKLEQIFQNLCENAIAYTPAGGRVEIWARAHEGRALVCVTDTGIGISEQDLPLIFERMHRTQQARAKRPSGTGLGLAIVKSAVEAHGGRVWAQSTPGEGSVFRFTLPLRSS